MGCHSTADSVPPKTGFFLVTVNIQNYYFRYIARFEKDTNRFYKADEFSRSSENLEDITELITGWHEDTIGVFLPS